MSSAEQRLTLVTRLMSIPLLAAVPCAVMPFAWMDRVHAWLGLGVLPAIPIVEYLARSCSLLYAMHGALILYLSFNVRRFLPVLRFLAYVGMGFGALMIPLDHASSLPPAWCWCEGSSIILESLLLLWLVRRAQPDTLSVGAGRTVPDPRAERPEGDWRC